jgi:hypothetical protein
MYRWYWRYQLFVILLSWVVVPVVVPAGIGTAGAVQYTYAAAHSPTGSPSWSPPSSNKAPTKSPVHVFGTFSPTRASTPVMNTAAPSVTNDTANILLEGDEKDRQESYLAVIVLGAVGGVVVIACCAVLIYWHTHTRVHAASSPGERGGLLDLQFLSCCCSCTALSSFPSWTWADCNSCFRSSQLEGGGRRQGRGEEKMGFTMTTQQRDTADV